MTCLLVGLATIRFMVDLVTIIFGDQMEMTRFMVKSVMTH